MAGHATAEAGRSAGPRDCFAGKLLPPALGFSIVHHKVRVSQLSARAEFEHLTADGPLENDGSVAERTIGDHDRNAADNVVDDLVPDHDPEWIGSCITV
jgi:hypothetical protein